MSADVAIRADNVSKKFCRYLRKSMLYGVQDVGRNLFRMSTKPNKLRRDEFWAVDDVSFEVRRGETLGIIGPNGSGKSTLLKMLNGIFMPDKGKIEIKGKVGALIELGAGFHPMLTARENIYISAAILGMSKKETDQKFSEIVEFSELAEFLDTPIKYYSSGMFARLGFSIIAHLDPDILLVDEVLAVGDIKFQNKALEKIMKIKENASVIFVSHNLSSVSMICDRALWLNCGSLRMVGDTQEVVSDYSKISMQELQYSRSEARQDSSQTVSGDIVVTKIEFADVKGAVRDTFEYGEDLILRCHYQAFKPLGKPYFQLDIRSPRMGTIFGASMIADGADRPTVNEGNGIIECHFKGLPLGPGIYDVDVNIRPESGMGKLFRHLSAAQFSVTQNYEKLGWKGPLAAYRETNVGAVFVPYSWRFPEKLLRSND